MSTVITQWVAEFVDNVSPSVDAVTEAANRAVEAIDQITEIANTVARGVTGAAGNAAKAIDGITVSGKKAGDEVQKLSDKDVDVDADPAPIDEVTEAAHEAAEAIEELGDASKKASDEVSKISAMDLKAGADAIRDLTDQFEDLMATGMGYEVQMKEVQSITQMTDAEMDKLSDSARGLAEEFGGNAAAQLQSFGSIIAQFGPAIANDVAAMDSMGNSVSTLSKLMKNDTVGAMDALTTSMLQFGVDLTNPKEAAAEMARMMHVMAAAGNEGASEVADTSAALKNAGIAAKNANLSFEETNSALQALAQAGSKGSEAGNGLRNVLGKMGGIDIIPRKAQEKLRALGVNYDIVADKTLPFTTRLRELQKAQGDATLIAQIFGIENEKSAMALINSIDAQEAMTQTITGTNAATESAGIVMESTAESISRMTAWVDDLKISLFNAIGGITPFIVGLGTVAYTIANIAAAVTGIQTLIGFIKGLSIVTHLQTAAQWLLNIAMNANPVGLIVLAIAALVAIVYVAIEYYDEFGASLLLLLGPVGIFINAIMAIQRNWDSVVEAFEADGIVGAIKRIGVVLFDAVLYPVQQLLEILSDIPGVGQYAATGAANIAELRKSFNLVDSEKSNSDEAAPGPLAAYQSGGTAGGNGATGGGTGGLGGGGKGKGKNNSDGVKLGGSSGGSGGKTINMTINNYITGFKGTKEMVDQVANAINTRLSDSLATL